MGQSLYDIIQNMLNSVMNMINTPGNQYYLPTWVQANGYDPYGTSTGMSWTVTLTDPNVIQTAANICISIQIDNNPCQDPNAQYIGAQQNPVLVLGTGQPGGMLVTGARNAYMASMNADPNNPYNITAVCNLSTLPSPFPPSIQLVGNFTFTQYCCCSLDGSTCSQTPTPQIGTGNFVATMNGQPTVTIQFNITNLAPNVLDIAVTGITFTPPYQPGTQVPNISITVQITSIPEGANQESYNNLAMEAFNSSAALQNINQQINLIMNDPAQLSFMSNVLTGVIDGYLKANNLYPFGPVTMAVF
jgi:hypothetical protein